MKFLIVCLISLSIICCCLCFGNSLMEKLCGYDEEKRAKVLECYSKNTDPGIISYSKSFLRCLLEENDSLLKLVGKACHKTFSPNERKWCFEEIKSYLTPYTEEIGKKDEAAIEMCFQ